MFQTTDLSDEYADGLQYCDAMFRNFGGKTKFHGPIHTVKVYEDNVLYLKALESVPAGTVVVVDGGGSRRCALMGDRLGRIAVERGLPGVILNGCVRDTAELAKLEVGILALASHPRKSEKRGEGAQGLAVAFGGVVWTPGHYVYADEDGVVLSATPL